MTAEQNTQATPAPTTARTTVAVTLQTPIERKGEAIKTIHLMKPRTGDLRGLLLSDLVQMRADAVATLLAGEKLCLEPFAACRTYLK